MTDAKKCIHCGSEGLDPSEVLSLKRELSRCKRDLKSARRRVMQLKAQKNKLIRDRKAPVRRSSLFFSEAQSKDTKK